MDGFHYEDDSRHRQVPVIKTNALPDEVGAILRTMLQNNQALISQNAALLSLLSGSVPTNTSPIGRPSSPHTQHHFLPPSKASTFATAADSTAQPSDDDKWAGILSNSAYASTDFTEAYFNWPRPPTLAAVLSERRAWTSWSYKASFPHLARFLLHTARAGKKERCPCQVVVEDFAAVGGEARTVVLGKASNKVEELWQGVRRRSGLRDISKGLGIGQDGVNVSARLWMLIDLSPVVLACLMGSSPQLDLSYIAAFTERHLKLSNWGKVSLLKFRDMSWSSYTFEYHFSFYYVTPDRHERDAQKLDRRQLRRSAPFGREEANKTRYIHEESLSFLLVGHFNDISTCIQLAESYFKYDPYARKLESHSFRPYNLQQSPALMLLSWIGVGLHHVSWRWQSAIEAVDREIRFSGQVVFMEDRTDLMADDPQFSLSKTYFWALQAYQLFEKTLLETIGTWTAFKEHSLPSLRDGRVDAGEWQTLVEDIDDAIAELHAKVLRIRTRIEEVRDLRTGLISASALFDSRTSVRQGENIRILTYITILFFPLSFVTSVFSMSFIGPDTKSAFAISLPVITLAAAILVFNLQNIVTAWSAGTERSSGWLRHLMRRHRREGWKEQAVRLHDDLAATKPPVTKARRRSSAWVYLLFLAEYLFVAIPVGEFAAAMRWLGIVGKDRVQLPLNEKELEILDENDELAMMARTKMLKAEAVRERIHLVMEEEARKEQKRRDQKRGIVLTLLLRSVIFIYKSAEWAVIFLFNFLRTLLLPIWLVLVGIEYSFLVVIFMIASWFYKDETDEDVTPLLPTESKRAMSISRKAAHALGLEVVFPPRQKPELVEDPEVLHIRRVKTQLGGISTPSLSVSSPRGVPSPKERGTKVVETEVAFDTKGSGNSIGDTGRIDGGKRAGKGDVLSDDMGDIMRVPRSSNEVTRKMERGARFARSGLKPGLEID